MSRARAPIQEGASKRLQRMRLFIHLVSVAMPDGIDRNEAISEYCVQTGLTLRKAEEHLNLLESTGMLRWEDLRLYTTDKGLLWSGYRRDPEGRLLDAGERSEEEYRSRTRINAQKVSPGTRLKRVGGGSSPQDRKGLE